MRWICRSLKWCGSPNNRGQTLFWWHCNFLFYLQSTNVCLQICRKQNYDAQNIHLPAIHGPNFAIAWPYQVRIIGHVFLGYFQLSNFSWVMHVSCCPAFCPIVPALSAVFVTVCLRFCLVLCLIASPVYLLPVLCSVLLCLPSLPVCFFLKLTIDGAKIARFPINIDNPSHGAVVFSWQGGCRELSCAGEHAVIIASGFSLWQ